jgi:hypothetical protein
MVSRSFRHSWVYRTSHDLVELDHGKTHTTTYVPLNARSPGGSRKRLPRTSSERLAARVEELKLCSSVGSSEVTGDHTRRLRPGGSMQTVSVRAPFVTVVMTHSVMPPDCGG